jgi:hypothetical protein
MFLLTLIKEKDMQRDREKRKEMFLRLKSDYVFGSIKAEKK